MHSIASALACSSMPIAANSNQQTLVVFDERVTGIKTLQAALVPGCTTVVMSAEQTDVITAITGQLSQTGANRLAIIAHGEPGVIHLGGQPLTIASLQQQAWLLAEWGVAEIALYACEVGTDSRFAAELAQLTGARVGAASGKVGAAALGGTWTLQGGVTPIFALEQLADYRDVFAGSSVTLNGGAGDDIANANTNTLTAGFTGGTLADLQDSIGDEINGFGGNDTLVGSTGNDTINGGEGNDSIQGGAGADSISGGNGDDLINGFFGQDIVDGGAGQDAIIFTTTTSVTDFNSANNTQITNIDGVYATVGGITINLSSQAEGFLVGSTGSNTIIGSQGADTFVLTQFSTSYTPLADAELTNVEAVSAALITLAFPGSPLPPNPSATAIINLTNQTESFVITGSVNADVLIGGVGNDTINGGTGSDFLVGAGGQDTILADAGSDTIYGGLGGDSLDGGADNDAIAGEEGDDTLKGGSGNDILSGNAGKDTLFGDDGSDYLLGDIGDDSLEGGIGNDTLFGGADNDVLSGGADNDFLLGGEGNNTLFGDGGDDLLIGDIGDDKLDGGEGNDILLGGFGSNTLLGGIGQDTLLGDLAADSLDGGTGSDFLAGNAGLDTLLGGDGGDTLYGGLGGDSLDGGADNDAIAGEEGDDILQGGSGNDILTGGSENDQFLFGGSGVAFNTIGLDSVSDFSVGEQLVLSQSTFVGLSNGSGFAAQFAIVSNETEAYNSSALIVYNSSNGALFYNQDGATTGYGTGGQFATLVNTPALAASDFTIVA
jgi:Ca2+-binding RTX toxin-like protein